jgi:hypothetical protein
MTSAVISSGERTRASAPSLEATHGSEPTTADPVV